ncbi:MAG: hypothetical protein JWM21_940 [Acidobacteria bacterium]|nr:hypothetical protein [Acidobacteriota bacterium]
MNSHTTRLRTPQAYDRHQGLFWMTLLLIGSTSLIFMPAPLRVIARSFSGDGAKSTMAKPPNPDRSAPNPSARPAGALPNALNAGLNVRTSYEGPEDLRRALTQNQAKPLSLAAGDFDEDGVPDLVSGYSLEGRGIIALRRGNVDSIYPNTPAAKERETMGMRPAPFLSSAQVSVVSLAPDYLGTGDFDADGHCDLVIAARGNRSLAFLPGDGQGNFGMARQVYLPGAVTALVAGEINRADGLTDVVVGVTGENGSEALVYEGPAGALNAEPESFGLSAPATSLALGQLTSAYTIDLAIAAGPQVLIVYGRDRMLTAAPDKRTAVLPARIESRSFNQDLKSLALRRVNGNSQPEIALLFLGGAVQVLSPGRNLDPKSSAGLALTEWVKSDFPSTWPGAERLIAADFSTSAEEDLLLLDSAGRRVRILQTGSAKDSANDARAGLKDSQNELSDLAFEGAEPVAVLPMQLDVDALTELVVLRQDQTDPVVVLTAERPNQEAARPGDTPAGDLFGVPNQGGYRSSGGQGHPTKAANTGDPRENKQVKPGVKQWQAPNLFGGCSPLPISVGQTINGTLATTDCFLQDGAYVDFYTFSGTAGQLVAITLNSSAFDAYLYLVSPNGSLLSSDDDGGAGTNANIPTAGGFISLPANGIYTIYATSFGPAQIGSYSLTLIGIGGGGPCPAIPIPNGLAVSGFLSTADCVFTSGPRFGSFSDVYTFNGIAGQQAIVAMASNSFDTFLYLTAPNGAQAENNDVQPGFDTNSRIPPVGSAILPVSGLYTIYATSFFPGATGSYAIGIIVGGAPTIVTNTNDSGPGSLRQAIINANANLGVDIISFQVPPPRTISPLTALPEITDPVVIDGTTQPGFAGTPLIELNGQFTPRGTSGLKISSGSSRVRGLVINRFGATDCSLPLNANVSVGTAIQLVSGGNNLIDGNFIGTNLSGTAGMCNSGNGIYLFNSSFNTVGGTAAAARNIVSANRAPGIAIGGEFSISNRVQGNFVGTDVTGTVDLGNQSNGIFLINGTSHVIGGTVPGSRNLVSGNNSPGIGIGFSDPAGILVQGNYIGTNAAGSAAIPNLGGGIIIGGFFQLNGQAVTATDNTIGGTTPAARNVISGNLRIPGDPNLDSGNGLEIINDGSQRNKVQGNYIGLNANGNGALPNAGSGVFITRAPNNFIGADVRADVQGTTNYIAANGRYGIGVGIRRLNDQNPGQFITGGDSVDIVYNVIGSDPSQTLRLGNGLDGVFVDADSVNIYVNSNVIAFNGRNGVRIPDANGIVDDNDNSGRLVNLDLNYIFGNASRAVDLGFEGLTPNDLRDGDGGANLQQNFPVLSSSTIARHEDRQDEQNPAHTLFLNVAGTLNSAPNTTFTVHWYFSPDLQCINNAQSSRPLAFGRIPGVITNANGDAPFNIPFDFPAGFTSGVINTTATDPTGNTSEYSGCFPVNLSTPATLQYGAASYSAGENDGFATINVVRTGDTAGSCSVNFATSDGTALQKSDYIIAAGTLTFAPGETSKTFRVLINDDLYAESIETVNLTLSNATGGTISGPTTVTLTINDNDTTTPTSNPLDNAQFFVKQQYSDFLSRVPDQSGLDYWTGQITMCGTTVACLRTQRVSVSNAFFFEQEYQQTGAYVVRLFRAAYGNNQPFPNPDTANQVEAKKLVSYAAFSPDRAQIRGGPSLAETQLDLANAFVLRPQFLAKYPGSLSGAAFVDAVLATINSDIGPNLASQRTALIDLFNQGGRGKVMYRLADDNATDPVNNRAFVDAEYNRTFVLTQYFGYLRRNPDIAGYLFWLGQVNSAPLRSLDKQRSMVCAFITAQEYQLRLSPVVTHNNTECQ